MGLYKISRTEVYEETFFVEAESESEATESLRLHAREPDIFENKYRLDSSIERMD